MVLASLVDRIINNLTLYDLTSGWIPCAALVFGVIPIMLRHNCHEHKCPKVGRVMGDDGKYRCKHHHRKLHPEYAA